MNDLMEATSVAIAAGGVAVGVIFPKLWKKFYVEPKAKAKEESEKDLKAKEEAAKIRVVEYKEERPRQTTTQRVSYQKRVNAGKLADETKRKNLQPGNIKVINEMINKTIHDVKNFEHKFFGTVLAIDGRVVIDGLPKRLHSFEVIDGVCYIDGSVVKIHPDEILKLARSIE
jgi:hypothetical protein